jgi:hypothetical protein
MHREAFTSQRCTGVARADFQFGVNDMTLLETISTLDELEEADTIYLQEPWTEESIAVVAAEPDGGGLPPEAKALGLSYFIEVAIARDFIEDWLSSLPSPATMSERCARLIQYAVNDA